jgi:Mg-chelatase subunit ChlD
MRAFVVTVLLAMLLACGLSCGSSGKQGVPSAGKPLSRTLSLVTADGTVEVRTGGGDFSPMKRGAPVSQVVEAHTLGVGGAVELLDGEQRIAKLWLKPRTEVLLGEDDARHVRLSLGAGEARLRALDPSIDLGVVTGGTVTSVGGRDVLLARVGDTSSVVDVGTNLEAAEWTFALEAEQEPAGIGTLDAKIAEVTVVDDGTPRPKPAPLRLQRLAVTGKLAGDFVETSVDHTFRNDGDVRLEGTFRFPLPDGAILVGLSMQIGDKMMEGSLVEAEKAQKVYEQIVDHMQDPALLQWEQGSTFKLRVFPIEPKSDKRVVLTYLAPLHRGIDGPEWVYATAAPGLQAAIPAFSVTLDGKPIFTGTNFVPGNDVVVPIVDGLGGIGELAGRVAFREMRDDGVYTAVHVRPDWSKVSARDVAAQAEPRRVLLVVDTSRSTLEERPLALETLRLLLSDLRPIDRFRLMTADVDVRVQDGGFVAPTAQSIEAAVQFVSAVEPDGASDVGAMLAKAATIVSESRKDDPKAATEVVYLGDGVATWGETDTGALQKQASAALGTTPLHAVVLGKGADGDTMRAIASDLGGRTFNPRTPLEARALSTMLSHATETKRLAHLVVKAGEGEVLFPARPTTLFEGDDLVVLVRTPKDHTASTTLALEATGYTQSLVVGEARKAEHVAQRWAVASIAALERDPDAKKEDIVKTSLDFGVMSKQTSFLVLESEEQYAEFDIARKAKKDAAPAVTGADLESIAARTASLEPNHLQPGDPELHLPAPADAQSVVVVLPFGETKIARWEDDLSAWTVRFLVDKDTPDGTYQIVVRITHHDGTLEVQRLEYVVDTKKPTVLLTMKPKKDEPGSYEVLAKQVVTKAELESTIPESLRGPSFDDDTKKFASVLTDTKRVEVRMPDGQQIVLTAIRLGEFRATWKPEGAFDPTSVPVHVVAVDRALNENVFDLVLSTKAAP